ncbi:MAG: hypothetical protein GY953_41395, partial [bacterium]|nr:hypothetical protein [bacterium]
MPAPPSGAISEPVLRRLGGDASFHRGRDYFLNNHVTAIEADKAGGITASVRDAQVYQVHMAADEGILDYSCDCAAGVEGAFCKHCVAAAVAWHASSPKSKKKRKARSKKITLASAQPVVRSLDKEALVDLLMETAREVPEVEQRIILLAATLSENGVNLTSFKEVLRKALTTRKFLEHGQMRSHFRRATQAGQHLEAPLADGHAYAVIELSEYALSLLMKQMDRVDDTEDHVGEIAGQLEVLHYQACEDARPDPDALAGRLLEAEMYLGWDVFSNAFRTYREILGPTGTATYRKLAEQKWESVPRNADSVEFSRITRVMESLTVELGDTDDLVQFLAGDLSEPF